MERISELRRDSNTSDDRADAACGQGTALAEEEVAGRPACVLCYREYTTERMKLCC